MVYYSAMNYIHSLPRTSGKPTLARMRMLMEKLGNPQDLLKFVHIAGTNGKGSIAAMTASVCRASGLRTGLYISPFINDFRERMSVNGVLISPEKLTVLTNRVRNAAKEVTAEIEDARATKSGSIPKELLSDDTSSTPVEFEIVTAIAFMYFLDARVDIVALECGLGGRYDATNVINAPELAIIMNIALDHTELLGDTVEKIAAEKCGIIKRGTDAVISYPQKFDGAAKVIKDACNAEKCTLFIPDETQLILTGCDIGLLEFRYKTELYQSSLSAMYQLKNAAVAVEAAHALAERGFPVTYESIFAGLRSVSFPSRFERISISPTVIVDGAHNADGVASLAASADAVLGRRGIKTHLLVGMLADKNPRAALAEFARFTAARGGGKLILGRVICVAVNNKRAMNIGELTKIVEDVFGGICDGVSAADNIGDAAKTLLSYAGERDAIISFGSLYISGEAKKEFLKAMK